MSIPLDSNSSRGVDNISNPDGYQDTYTLYNNKIHKEIVSGKVMYYIPAYLVVVVKRLDKFNFTEGTVSVSMTIALRLAFDTALDKAVQEKLKNPKLRLNEQNCDLGDVELKYSKTAINLTCRMAPEITFEPRLHNFPFDFQYLDMKFELTSQTGIHEDGKEAFAIRFNFHKNTAPDAMLRFKMPKSYIDESKSKKDGKRKVDESTRLINKATIEVYKLPKTPTRTDIQYDIEHASSATARKEKVDFISELNVAFGILTVPITPPEVKMNNGEMYFPVVELSIPLFREPEFVLLSSCLPLLLLNIIALGIYILDPYEAYGDRIASIITILLALFAFLPSYRGQVPVATITSLDAAFYVSILVLFLIMVDSVVGALRGVDIQRIIFPAVSGTLVACMTLYVIFKYIKYRRDKDRLEEYQGGGTVSISPDWDLSEWRCARMELPVLTESGKGR